MPGPGPHPLPPGDIRGRTLPIRTTSSLGISKLLRIHQTTRGAIYFGTSGKNRWDHPRRGFGVMYAGKDDYCAFIETFGQDTGIRLIEEAELDTRSLSEIPIKRMLDLVDITGAGLARLGADNRLAECDFAISQEWAKAFFAHPARIDGILYRARHDPSRLSIAVFNRARGKLGVPIPLAHPLGSPSSQRRLGRLLDHYGFGLV